MPIGAHTLAHLIKTDHVSWCADRDGVLTCRGGPAVERFRTAHPEYIPVATVWELYHGRADLLRLFTDALRGNPHPACVAEWHGFLWQIEMQTMGAEGQGITGVQCTAFIMEPAPGEMTAAAAPEPGGAVYEAAGDNAPHGVWSGDRFWDCPDEEIVLQIRLRARSEFSRIVAADPSRIHLLRASAASRPALRLL